jgi:YggT family protein
MIVLANFLVAVAKILDIGLSLYMWIIIGRAVISWVNPDPYNPIVRFLNSVTEPVLYPIRRRLPLHFGGIDFSPIIVILAIIFAQSFLVQTLYQFAARMSGWWFGASGVNREREKTAVIRMKVVPRSSRNQVLEGDSGVWRLKVTSAPVEGKANKAVREYLAKCLGIAKGRVEIISGEKAKLKSVRIEGLDRKTVERILAEHALKGG